MSDDQPDRRAKRRRGAGPPPAASEPVVERRAPAAAPADAALLAELRAAGLLDQVVGPVAPAPPVVGPVAPRQPLDNACATLLEIVRKRCPGLLPAAPLPAGTPLAPLPILPTEAGSLIGVAARQAVLAAAGARIPSDPAMLPATVLWQDGPAALLVEVGAIAVQLDEGLVSIGIPVRCDQLPRGRELVTVEFVVGTPARPAGMLAAASEPRGSRVVVERWGEALLGLAWQALLDAVGGVAGAAGVDEDGAVLVPTALTASANGLALTAQARHGIDRIRPGQVVLAPERQGDSPR
jgi:hypothetical protein